MKMIVILLVAVVAMTYGAPQYAAPAPSYAAPAPVRVESYKAPAIVHREAYAAPVHVKAPYAAVAYEKPHVPIVKLLKTDDHYGNYNLEFETGDGHLHHENGALKQITCTDPSCAGQQVHVKVQHGSYSWTSPEGQRFTVSYTADENGFHPVGDHLPTPPPIPVEIQKTLHLHQGGQQKSESSYGSYAAPAPKAYSAPAPKAYAAPAPAPVPVRSPY